MSLFKIRVDSLTGVGTTAKVTNSLVAVMAEYPISTGKSLFSKFYQLNLN